MPGFKPVFFHVVEALHSAGIADIGLVVGGTISTVQEAAVPASYDQVNADLRPLVGWH